VCDSDALPFHTAEPVVFSRFVGLDVDLGSLLLFSLNFTVLSRSVQLDAFAGTRAARLA
jgi:hypothetical protein